MKDNTQAKSEQVQDKPAKKPKLAVGQVWKNRRGDVITVKKYLGEHAEYTFEDALNTQYTEDGSYIANNYVSMYDLTELVKDAPTQATKPVVKHIYFYSATVYKKGNQTNVSGLYTSYGVKIQSEEDYAEFMQNIAHSLMADRQDLHVTTLSYLGESE